MRDNEAAAPVQPEWPPRALAALDEQLVTCSAFVRERLPAVVADAEDALFRRASQSRNNTEQEQCLASVAALKRHRGSIATDILARLPERLQELGRPAPVAANTPESNPTQVGLALLAEQSQDQRILLADLASRAEARATMELFELGHRYAVLIGSPVLESAQQPFSPGGLCECVREVVSALPIEAEHQAEIYRAFERGALRAVSGLYETLNARLVARGILPNLRTFAPRRQGEPNGKRDYREAQDASTESADSPPETGPANDDAQASSGASPMPAAPRPGAAPPSMGDHQMFAALSSLIALRRQQAGPSPARGKLRDTSAQDLDEVLGSLQQRPATTVARSGKLQPRSMQSLRRDMLAQLRKADPEGASPQFSAPQRDVIELMTMLFDRLGEDIHSTEGGYLLSELQAPLLRVAMNDETFFTNRMHPARHWLDKVTEASARWGASDGQDDGAPELIERIHGMNRAINRDFDGDPVLFEGMSADLQKQLDQLAHRAAIAERRQVEAARGRERLELARKHAEELVLERVASGSVPSLTRNMLQYAWTDLLALSLLRHGEDSEAFRRDLAIVDALGKGKPTPDDADNAQLRTEVEEGLTQVGMAPREANLLAREATGAPVSEHDESDDQLTRTELAVKLKQRAPVGIEQVDQLTKVPPTTADAEHAATVARIRKMAFGTWFEFDDPELEKPVRRKMAWYSTQTGRCLFVNRRGMKTHDTSIDHLAQTMLAGSARVVDLDRGSFIDRAWTAILGNLKKLTGGDKAQEQRA